MLFPSSPRLQFRFLTVEDIPALNEFFTSEEAMKFLSWDYKDPTVSVRWVERQQWRYEKYNGRGLWGIELKETGKLLGQCGLLDQEVDGTQELEVGYHLLPSEWKNGYATEAARACMDFAFGNNMSSSIISLIDVLNFNSQAVAERNGLKRERTIEYMGHQTHVFRISKEEWLASKQEK